MKPLTSRQLAIMLFIQLRVERRGAPPTIREIGNHMGIKSTNGVGDHLKAIIKKGYLEQGKVQASRSLRILHRVDVHGNVIQSDFDVINNKAERLKEMFRGRCGRWPEAERAVDELVEMLR